MDMHYCRFDHEQNKELSLKWWDKTPKQGFDCLEYGLLQYRLKDYKEAVIWFEKAKEQGILDAWYQLASCLFLGLGMVPNQEKAELYFGYYIEEIQSIDIHTWSDKDKFQLATCYANGWGAKKDDEKAYQMFHSLLESMPEAKYELGYAYAKGTLGCKKDLEKAKEYLRAAYEQNVEEAIFLLYECYQKDFSKFPYQKELVEAYSYRLGKYMRVVHVNPGKEAYQNLANLYLQGFPGDTGEADIRFKRKAKKYLKLIGESYV